MTAPDPTSLLSQADAAIAVRREMLAAGTPDREVIHLLQSTHRMVAASVQQPPPMCTCGEPWPKGLLIVTERDRNSIGRAMARESHWFAHIAAVAAVVGEHFSPALAAATDHAESVLGRHAPWRCCEDHDFRCRTCAPGDDWPCPDARDALTALGIVVE